LRRSWGKVVTETRTKITHPTPSSKICNLIRINHPKLKRLVKEGVLSFVGIEENDEGPPHKLYQVSRLSDTSRTQDETKKRTS